MFRSIFNLGLVGALAVGSNNFAAGADSPGEIGNIDPNRQLVFKVKGLT
jgi:hypothetical protein